ncbi:heterokaryon incompatibility protein-domain-containing protein [Fomes fomentarius]|nr:heterokaryon incompatibility protein-domain-containing protein [Fomes fomentarius]
MIVFGRPQGDGEREAFGICHCPGLPTQVPHISLFHPHRSSQNHPPIAHPEYFDSLALTFPFNFMMWLLRARTAELHHYVSPDVVVNNYDPESGYLPGYAILSHVWGENEQTFQDIRALPSKCAAGETPRDLASEKIRNACILAEQRGYEWIWIDTCCVDNTSSAELSEAINSMFRYYSLADICFAYLQDVSSDDESMPEDQFKQSRWHKRGGTLQELIAPDDVRFVSESWMVIGSKMTDAILVEAATGVPATVLKNRKCLMDFSIAQRMSWAAGRMTTRVEDEAYCLFGIFDINMPTLYGEGRKAFRRLQEELMRQYPDTTLFAWGQRCTWSELEDCRGGDYANRYNGSQGQGERALFAPSPASFGGCSDIRFSSNAEWRRGSSIVESLRSNQHNDLYMNFAVTPHGVSATIPVMTIGHQLVGYLGWEAHGRELLLLILQPSSRTKYSVGVYLFVFGQRVTPRLVYAPYGGREHRIEWKGILLAHEPEVPDSNSSARPPTALSGPPDPCDLTGKTLSPFHFPLLHSLRYNERLSIETDLHLLPLTDIPDIPWDGDRPAKLYFLYESYGSPSGGLVLCLGVCRLSSPETSTTQRGRHWAHLLHRDLSSVPPQPPHPYHSCTTDHILQWPDLTKKYGFMGKSSQQYQATISFTPHGSDQTGVLVLRLTACAVDSYDPGCHVLECHVLPEESQLELSAAASDDFYGSINQITPLHI